MSESAACLQQPDFGHLDPMQDLAETVVQFA
jgi:hypothetical protein